MKLTSDPKRIEQAHYILQKLEDQIVGDMVPTTPEAFIARLQRAHKEVWQAIYQLNEAYDVEVK